MDVWQSYDQKARNSLAYLTMAASFYLANSQDVWYRRDAAVSLSTVAEMRTYCSTLSVSLVTSLNCLAVRRRYA